MSITFSAWVSLEVSRLFPASSLSICFFLLCVICHHLPLMFFEILPSLSPPLPSFHSETLSLAQPFCNSTLSAPRSPSGVLPSILISFKPPLWWCSKCTTLFKHAGFATYLCRFSALTAAHMVANSATWRAYPNICPHSCFTASISQFLCLECYSSLLILKRQFKFLCSCLPCARFELTAPMKIVLLFLIPHRWGWFSPFPLLKHIPCVSWYYFHTLIS